MITKEKIIEAHERIKPFVHRRPVLTSASMKPLVGVVTDQQTHKECIPE